MNYLAHAVLAGPDPLLRLGGLMGDFVKGPLRPAPAHLPERLTQGLRLHRAIDAYAETHPAFRASRARVSPERRRVAGIMVDLFYDHFLARGWAAWPTAPGFAAFSGNVSLAATPGAVLAPPPASAETGVAASPDHGIGTVDSGTAGIGAPTKRGCAQAAATSVADRAAPERDRPVVDLATYCTATYALFADHAALLPPRLAEVAPLMATHDWLGSYAEAATIALALDRMAARRFSRPTPLAGGGAELLDDYDGFAADFRAFFADALDFARQWRQREGLAEGGE